MRGPKDHDDSSLRRSALRNLSNVNTTNDDEAERAIRRRTLGKSTTLNTSNNDSFVEDQEGLKTCLKIFQDNKINKDNAWSLTLIDNMAKLCSNHHKTLKNFQIVGTTLEATSKIYGLRVDSVHSDVVRMSTGLGRMKPGDNQANDDEVGGEDHGNSSTAAGVAGENVNEQPKPAVKKKRVRKQVSTYTKNKDTLNARLDVIPLPDPLFSKLNSIMGDVSSSRRLLLNILQTKTSDLKMTMNEPFWDNSPHEPLVFSDDNQYDYSQTNMIELPLKLECDAKQSLRQQMSGYLISNTPIDDDEDEAPVLANNSFNQSQIDYAFDMNAEVEPILHTENYAIDYDIDCDGGNGFDELNNDDIAAITACKGLRRKTTIIEDLRPADTTKLEYSYRPMDNMISQFWAGPSYWKFRKSRKVTMGKETTMGSMATDVVALAPLKRKINRSKNEPAKFADVTVAYDYDQFNDAAFISLKSKAAQKLKKSILYKRWDSKKLKLPTDLQIDRQLFDSFTYWPKVSGANQNDPNATPFTETTGYEYENTDDNAYALNSQPDDDDMDRDMDHGLNMVHDDKMDIADNIQVPDTQQHDQTALEIGLNFEGAPEMIQKIEIQFARRAKVIDMKQMKSVCLTSIVKQCEKTCTRTFNHPKNARTDERYKDGAASFGVIYNNLPHSLSKMMAENLSPSVAFYSILHLANEHRLRLYKSAKHDEMNMFFMRQLE